MSCGGSRFIAAGVDLCELCQSRMFIPSWWALVHLSAFDYVYILLWNSIWTIAPVIGIGLFDRFLGMCSFSWHSSVWLLSLFSDSHVLMQVPEIYHYGREGTWFGMRLFFIYMFDGLVQVSLSSRQNENAHWLLNFVVCYDIFLHLLYVYISHLKGRWFWYRTNRVLNREWIFPCIFWCSLSNMVIDDGYLSRYGCQYVCWFQYHRLVRLDLLCCLRRNCHYLGFHCMWLCGVVSSFCLIKVIGNRQQLIDVHDVWEQSVALPFSLFLALPASHIHTCHGATLFIQGMAIHLPA